VLTGAAVDCERILEGWGQPVNTITAFAFVAVAIMVLWRGASWPTSLLIAGVGVGSILFHGPMPPGAEFLHDLSIGWVLVWIILSEAGRLRLWPWGFGVVGLLMFTPIIADPGQAVLAAVSIVVVLNRRHRFRWWMLGLLGLGALVGTFSRTDGPWCLPDSIWQGHGFWHVASATALALWAIGEKRTPVEPSPDSSRSLR
jgi:hypothetical protein